MYGGGSIEKMANDLDYLIQQYSPTDDKWSSLPPARTPVRWFGLGKLNGQLVAVGGMTNQRQVTEKVHTFDGKWKEFLPPMPTARHSPAVFSKPSCLSVVGGVGERDKRLSSVETFIPDTSQWHKASPAPSPLSHMTTTGPQQAVRLVRFWPDQLSKLVGVASENRRACDVCAWRRRR